MCKFNKKGGRKIDPCMVEVINNLNEQGVRTLACCCGHGVYPMTIVIDKGCRVGRVIPMELFSGVHLNRKKKFYVKGKNGIYMIPESLGGEL